MIGRLNALIDDIRRDPFGGLGKPEPLKAVLQGCWSRRLTVEHRIVYAVEGEGKEQIVTILQCRYHYYGAAAMGAEPLSPEWNATTLADHIETLVAAAREAGLSDEAIIGAFSEAVDALEEGLT